MIVGSLSCRFKKRSGTKIDRFSPTFSQAHRTELDQLAEALLKYETLDSEDVKSIVGGNAEAVAKKFGSSSLLLKQQANESKTDGGSLKPHPIPVELPVQ